MSFRSIAITAAALTTLAAPLAAQSLGTFRWQLQPFCNIVQVTVTQQGAIYTLDGYDDQCGAAASAPLVGVGTPNNDGSLTLGLHIVTTPSARPVAVAARISPISGHGTWTGKQGARLLWQPATGAFRAGAVDNDQWADYRLGPYSTATGFDTTASGHASVAMGDRTSAPGRYGVAMGVASSASGEASVALGSSFTSGAYALAAGFATNARGVASMALGHISTAGADLSVALGRRAVTTPAATGSFVFGDNSNTDVVSATPNQFLVRASGGAVFYSTSDTIGGPNVALMPGASAWSTLSDANTKENFADLQDEEVLRQIAALPVRAWNFKAQDAAIRHIGPTAQDFHAAFGLGEDPRRINSLDADGVALAAIRALEVRTRSGPFDAERRAAENLALRAEVAALLERVARLEAFLPR